VKGQANIVRQDIMRLIEAKKINVLFIEYPKVGKEDVPYAGIIDTHLQKRLDGVKSTYESEGKLYKELEGEIARILDTYKIGEESAPYLRDLIPYAIRNDVKVCLVDLSIEHFVEIVTKKYKVKCPDIKQKTAEFMISISGMMLRNEKIAKEMIKHIDPTSAEAMEYVLLIGSDHVNGVKGDRYTVQKQLKNRLKIPVEVFVSEETSGKIIELEKARKDDQKLQSRIEAFEPEVTKTAKVKAALEDAEERLETLASHNIFGDWDVDPLEIQKETEVALTAWGEAMKASIQLLGDYTPDSL